MKKTLSAVLLISMLLSMLLIPTHAADTDAANKTEIHEFHVFDEASEGKYLLRTDAGARDSLRFSDKQSETVYHFTITNHKGVRQVIFEAALFQQLLLQVSQDDTNWTDVYRYPYDPVGEPSQGLDLQVRQYDLTPYVNLEENPNIYIRIADSEPSNGWGGTIYAPEIARLKVDYNAETRLETHSFFVFEESETKYLLRSTAGNNGSLRFSDMGTETIYHFNIINHQKIKKVTFKATFSQQLYLQVSHDDKTWTDVYRFPYNPEAASNQGLARGEIEFDLTALVNLADYPDLYIRIADAEASNGWGGSIWKGYEAKLTVEYIPLTPAELDAFEARENDRFKSLLVCNEPFGAFAVDTKNMTAGSSSLMAYIGSGHASEYIFPKTVNGDGYDALEFDLYVSDVALFDVPFGDTGLELSSSGRCDYEEISWTLAQIKEGIEGDVVPGWNHVTLYVSEAKTSGWIYMNAINYFRFFSVSAPSDTGMTVGIDNIRLTKAGAERDARILLENQKIANAVVTLIAKIGEVTKDSLSALREAEDAFALLNDAQKALITNGQVLQAARETYDALMREDDKNPSTENEAPTTPSTQDTQQDKAEGTLDIGTILIGSVIVLAAVFAAILFAKTKETY